MFILDNITIRGRYYPQYSRKNVDSWRELWDSQQIAVEFDVITGETAREVYESTRPSRHFEERKGVGLCPISSNPAEKNPEVRVIIFFPNIILFQ